MDTYIDAFALPIPKRYLEDYKAVVEEVAEIWKEYGAISYHECIGDDLNLKGTRSFITALEAKEGEAISFGWVVFPSKEVRDQANQQVPKDPRMEALVSPLTQAENLIFDPSRMVYGGFKSFVSSPKAG